MSSVLGQPSVESAGAPDLETMRETVAEVADRRNVEMPEDDELASIQGQIKLTRFLPQLKPVGFRAGTAVI